MNCGLDVDKWVGKQWDKGEATAKERDKGHPDWPEQWVLQEERYSEKVVGAELGSSGLRDWRASLARHLLLWGQGWFPEESWAGPLTGYLSGSQRILKPSS